MRPLFRDSHREEERQRALRQREPTTNHPVPRRRRGERGEGDQLPGVGIEKHRGGCLLPLPAECSPHGSDPPSVKRRVSAGTLYAEQPHRNYDANAVQKPVEGNHRITTIGWVYLSQVSSVKTRAPLYPQPNSVATFCTVPSRDYWCIVDSSLKKRGSRLWVKERPEES